MSEKKEQNTTKAGNNKSGTNLKLVTDKTVSSKMIPQKANRAKAQDNKTVNKTYAACNIFVNPLMEIMMTKATAPSFEKIAQDAQAASRESFEAISKSYSILTKGYESIMRTSMALSQSAAEKQAAYAKQAMGCKTLNELAEMQSKVSKESFDEFMSNMTKISEMSTKVLTESAEPLNEQLNKAVQKMSEAA